MTPANLAWGKEVLRWPEGAGRLGGRIRSREVAGVPFPTGTKWRQAGDLDLHAVAASMAGLEGDARDGRGEAEGDGRHWPEADVGGFRERRPFLQR